MSSHKSQKNLFATCVAFTMSGNVLPRISGPVLACGTGVRSRVCVCVGWTSDGVGCGCIIDGTPIFTQRYKSTGVATFLGKRSGRYSEAMKKVCGRTDSGGSGGGAWNSPAPHQDISETISNISYM